jgi:hypothetical protein
LFSCELLIRQCITLSEIKIVIFPIKLLQYQTISGVWLWNLSHFVSSDHPTIELLELVLHFQ